MSVEVRVAHRLGSFALDVEFAVERPGITALFGASGSGKTTTIDAVAGLSRPASGRVVVNGDVVLDTERGIFVPPRRRRFGYVFQDARLFPHLSVRSNLLFGQRRSPRPAPRAEVDRVIDMLGVGPLLERRPRHLSGGERQRVALGRALLSSPRLLLLDEPLAALDAARVQEILPYLERLRDEASIPMLYVSHSVDEVARLADDILVLDGGAIAARGSVFDVFSRLDAGSSTGLFEPGAVVATRVLGHDREARLTRLGFGDQQLLVPEIAAPPGAPVRVRIRARDVTLAIDRPGRISANNVLLATVCDLRIGPGAEADVQLECDGARIVARITAHSAHRLGLERGSPVHAIVKSVTVERRG